MIEQVAEDLLAYIPRLGPVVGATWPDVSLYHAPSPHPMLGHASRVRFAEDAFDVRRDAVRGWFREHGRERFTWWIGPSATPRDVRERLVAAGCEPRPEDPTAEAMVASAPPPPSGVTFDIRRVETYAEFVEFVDLHADVFGLDADDRRAAAASLDARWAARDPQTTATFVAYVDGAPAAFGNAVLLDAAIALMGGGVRAEHRGRGLFRALVRRRWDEAVARGTPTLVVQAGRMSRPILDRLGFASVATVHVLVDTTA